MSQYLRIAALGRSFRLRGAPLWLFGLGLAQAGEFAFVLFTFAGSAGVLAGTVVEPLTLAVAISMLLTPLLFILYERVIMPRAGPSASSEASELGSALSSCSLLSASSAASESERIRLDSHVA